jgi:hypothetical protein
MAPLDSKIEGDERQTKTVVAKDGLAVLLVVLGLSDRADAASRLDNPVLVAIDFEKNTTAFLPESEISEAQVGLAIMDSRALKLSVSPEHTISSHNFISGPKRYQRKAISRFLFGSPKSTTKAQILSKIEESLPKGRNILLVGHGIRLELRILKGLGFNFQGLGISGCLDTFQITSKVLPYFTLTLGELLKKLDYPHNKLHNAGNNETFTLRALLLLTVRSQGNYNTSATQPLAHLQSIASLPLPTRTPINKPPILDVAGVIDARRAGKARRCKILANTNQGNRARRRRMHSVPNAPRNHFA